MKKHDIFTMLADAGIKKVNQNSYTVQELSAADELKRARTTWQEIAVKMVKKGLWGKCFKNVDGRIIPSYYKL